MAVSGLFRSLPPCLTDVALEPRFTEEKTENATQYKQYVDETKALRDELGILLKEELYGSK